MATSLKVSDTHHRAIWWNLSRKMASLQSPPAAASGGESEVLADLTKKKCVPCESDKLRPMSEGAANELLSKVPGWKMEQVDGKLRLHRSWKTKSFLKGLDFFKLVGEVAEAEGHHPDLHLVGYNNVSVEIYTHSVGGLTENDFILAAKIGTLEADDLFRKPKL